MHRGLAVARWMSLGWSGVVVVVGWEHLRHASLAVVGLVAAGLLAVWATIALRRPPAVPPWLHAVVATGLLAFDGGAFDPGHTGNAQNLAGAAPVIAAAGLGVAYGRRAGSGFGALMVVGRLVGTRWNSGDLSSGSAITSFAASAVFLAVTGVVSGHVMALLRRVETEISHRRAREDVARTLHDTVLQTLAVVSRRTSDTDPELAELARRTDEDLRSWMRTGRSRLPTTLTAAINAAVALPTGGPTVTVNVVCDEADEQALPRAIADAVAGAVGEAVRNADRHGHATGIVVYAELDDELFASVRDNGTGFDPAITSEGSGIAHSMRDRIAAVKGMVEIRSSPGSGTDVRIRVPWRR